ncbi:MAG: hypothetical protein KY462_15005 [Actinobacteria bacterium]|nr:hypothetical protein [Actinomycetota bacterium]
MGGGEPVEDDSRGGVGGREVVERGEDVSAGGLCGAVFGKESGQVGGGRDRAAQVGFDQSEDQQREPDDGNER